MTTKAKATKTIAKKSITKKAAKTAPKQATTRLYRTPDQKFRVNPEYKTREGTMMEKMVSAAAKLKTFTRDELVNVIKSAKMLKTEKRARGFIAWSLGHNVFVDAK